MVPSDWHSSRPLVGIKWCTGGPADRFGSHAGHILWHLVAAEAKFERRYLNQLGHLTTSSESPERRPSAPPVGPSTGQRLKTVDDFTLHDVEAVRLILRGGSVLDWHRLNFTHVDQARRFIRNHELKLTEQRDRGFVDHVRHEAVEYLRRHFNAAIPQSLEKSSLEELLMAASEKAGHKQVCACTVLKTMQIIHHLAGRELLFRLPVSDRDLFHLVEEKVYRVVGTMLSEGFPITEFIGGRKNLDSTYTKLLSKPQATASALFDKLRFRIVTRTREHLLPVLLYLTDQLFPFTYIVPGESANTIFHYRSYCEQIPHLSQLLGGSQEPVDDALTPNANRFSAQTYRTIQFVADIPVRVPQHLMELAPVGSENLGPVVYMLCEFQLLDAETEAANESGDASHEAYKRRQREEVSRRLRLGERSDPGASRRRNPGT